MAVKLESSLCSRQSPARAMNWRRSSRAVSRAAVAEGGTVTRVRVQGGCDDVRDLRHAEIEEGRTAHLQGEIPAALGTVGPELLAKDPDIRTVEIVAVK